MPEIVFKYNITWHRAINKTPVEVFRRWSGINVSPIINASEDEILEAVSSSSGETASINLSVHDELDIVIYEVDNISDHQSDSVWIRISTETDDGLMEYHTAYLNRMSKDADVHFHRLSFIVGDKVLVKLEFDTNKDTNKSKMDGFYEDGVWKVIEVISNQKLRIEKNGVVRTIEKNMIKKVDL